MIWIAPSVVKFQYYPKWLSVTQSSWKKKTIHLNNNYFCVSIQVSSPNIVITNFNCPWSLILISPCSCPNHMKIIIVIIYYMIWFHAACTTGDIRLRDQGQVETQFVHVHNIIHVPQTLSYKGLLRELKAPASATHVSSIHYTYWIAGTPDICAPPIQAIPFPLVLLV